MSSVWAASFLLSALSLAAGGGAHESAFVAPGGLPQRCRSGATSGTTPPRQQLVPPVLSYCFMFPLLVLAKDCLRVLLAHDVMSRALVCLVHPAVMFHVRQQERALTCVCVCVCVCVCWGGERFPRLRINIHMQETETPVHVDYHKSSCPPAQVLPVLGACVQRLPCGEGQPLLAAGLFIFVKGGSYYCRCCSLLPHVPPPAQCHPPPDCRMQCTPRH